MAGVIARIDLQDLLINVGLVLLGAVIGAVVNYCFARRSSKELRAETARLSEEATRLSREISHLARLMRDAGLIDAEFDEAGNLLRIFKIEIIGTATAGASAHAILTVDYPDQGPDQEPDTQTPG